MLSEVFRFRRRLQKIRQAKKVDEAQLAKLTQDIDLSVAMVESRRQNLPKISYHDELPIAQKSELIKKTILENQVTILCGETGSGKTTQLPKICLDIGLGVRGKIAHTQPRRLAARAVSQRIAEELGTELGNEVGFKVRFSDKSNQQSYIKLMTDGILLAECNHDTFLNQYDTIIIDEAHERSLNIDFLLGYLHRLINKRKDLKIIITSATIDPERFARHFNDAPVINVSGRTYPVEVRYRPYQSAEEENSKTLQDGIIEAVNELSKIDRGDILIFLSGERDIRETADALANEKHNRHLDNTEVLPLLARLSNAEQNRIFHSSSKRRIVLATNVAETSLTVPGIKYVIDSGVARISRYSWRSKIQRLPIEKISQASANQRKGRCGRMSAGICIRLYDENDFDLRDEFTEPEIKRTNLASVILQMESMRLGHIDDFPFVEPPEDKLVNDGYKLLFELGAINKQYQLTKIGKHISHFPIDPKLACILLQAKNENALREVLIIVSALATQDPRERPLDKQQAADEKHAIFKDKISDFIFYINLWQSYHAEKKELSSNQLRKWCRKNFISWMRMREWIDTFNQIKKMLASLKLNLNTNAASYEQIHRALLFGLLANIGIKDEGKEYIGARNKKFNIFPGSALFKSTPQWIMSAEIVETTKVYARTNAKIDVAWIEPSAKHLLKYHYQNPHWEKKRSHVVALEQASLYGLIIHADKKVSYGRINPIEAREIFIRCALIAGDFESTAAFYQHNRQLIKDLESLEAKSRRRDVIVDENILFDFYNQTLPADIFSGATLDKWLRHNSEEAKTLFLSNDYLIRDDATIVSDALFPDSLEMNGARFPLEYHFDPRKNCDGLTLITPVAGLAAVNPQRCEWLIPGLLQDKIIALIKSLPKSLRKNFVPAPNFAEACVQAFTASDEIFKTTLNTAINMAIANHLKKMTGVYVAYDAWDEEKVAPHLLMNFRVMAEDGSAIEEGRDLQLIKNKLAGVYEGIDEGIGKAAQNADGDLTQSAEINAGSQYDQDNISPDSLDAMAESVEIELQGITITAYPALVKDGRQVNLRVLTSQKKAVSETHQALRQLLSNALSEQVKNLKTSITNIQNLCLKYSDFGCCEDLKQNIINKTLDEIFLYKPIKSSTEFTERLTQGRSELHDVAKRWSNLISNILDGYRVIKKLINKPALSQLDIVTDIQAQLECLFPPDFIKLTNQQWLQEYPRYLKAIEKRFDKSKTNATRDRQLRIDFNKSWDEYIKRQAVLEKKHVESDQLDHYRWMLEEYRVSLFAQELKTKFPVSEKRLKKYWRDISV
ncbi:ATP-dependent helicase HrpA [hydrothermal vent metagenome]|uniref:ATP-dependent helicase HrpA n=1 Tax=hydrothermal vent metagenome TaxID=652676 RepID=A0A3B0W2S8_9ZZZZ